MLPPVGQGSPLIRTNIKAEPVVALLGISIWSYLIVTVLPLLVGVLVKAVSDVLFSVRLLMSKSQLSVVVVVSVQLGMLKTPNERINRAIIP